MSDTVEKPEVDTVQIEIDGVELDVPKGAMIIEAADKAGIGIPRFCYHKKLSIAANCRMCLVDVEKAPKPLPACATPVMDGMKVYTQSKRAVSAQQNVMEFLLINHPLDCPICDQGGECELQDVSMGYGRSVSRFTERKRVVKDEDLGSLIATDMTRCIHCTRCVRFLDEISGTNELGGIGRGDRMAISTFIGRSIDSELSGNIIDLCPVGALTNKPFRFKARAWEMRSRDVVAAHDAVGSNQHVHLLRGRILRTVPRDNEAINESWLSDRDRWGFQGLYSDERLTRPMVKRDGEWKAVSWDEALDAAVERLSAVKGEDMGFLLSPRASNEELYLAQRLARGLGCDNVDHRLRQRDFADDATQGFRPGFEMPIADLDGADAVLLVGSHIRHDQPILGHRLRQAWRKGGIIQAINPVDYDFHFDLAEKAIVKPSAMVDALAGVASALKVKAEGELGERIKAAKPDAAAKAMAKALKDGERSVLILGDYGVQHPQASWLRALARAIAGAAAAAYNELPAAANGAGAWTVGAVPHRGAGGTDVASPGLNARAMLAQPRKLYLTYDLEPSLDTADGAGWETALQAAETVIHLGSFADELVQRHADILLPLAVLPECEGSLINADGQIQVSGGAGTPPGDARAGWKVLRVLGFELEIEGFGYTRIDQVRAEIMEAQPDEPRRAEIGELAAAIDGEGLEAVIEVPIYAGDGLQRRSRPLQRTAHGETGSARIHPEDLGDLAGKESVTLVTDGEELELPLVADERVARGSVRLPAGVPGTAALIHGDWLEVKG